MGSSVPSLWVVSVLLLLTTQAQPKEEYAPGRVLVMPRPGVLRTQSAASLGVKLKGRVGHAGIEVYSIMDGTPVQQKLKQLRRAKWAQTVEPDYVVRIQSTTPNDTQFGSQWHHPVISTPPAWDLMRGMKQVQVCHMDSGVQPDHPDLAPNIVAGINIYPAGDQSAWWDKTYGHGTHTAGLVAAAGNNGLGVTGVAWNVGLLVCSLLDGNGKGYVSHALYCSQWFRGQGAQVATLSFSSSVNPSLLEAEMRAANGPGGMLYVVSAGNSARDLDTTAALYPSSYNLDNVLSVGASDGSDALAWFSNWGLNTVDIVAPGVDVYSTIKDSTYGALTGTSQATPLVAGAAALLLSIAKAAGVSLTPLDMKQHLLNGADKKWFLADKVGSGGRLNAAASLQLLQDSIVKDFLVWQSSTVGVPYRCKLWRTRYQAAHVRAARQLTGRRAVRVLCTRPAPGQLRIVTQLHTGPTSLTAARDLAWKLNAAVVDGTFQALLLPSTGEGANDSDPGPTPVLRAPPPVALVPLGGCVAGFPDCPHLAG